MENHLEIWIQDKTTEANGREHDWLLHENWERATALGGRDYKEKETSTTASAR